MYVNAHWIAIVFMLKAVEGELNRLLQYIVLWVEKSVDHTVYCNKNVK